MVETRNISLGGLLFHVELPAYQRLQRYLSDLKDVLRGAEGEADILQEVEYRLAELFTIFMGVNRTVVTLDDVEKARGQLGEPIEFGDPTVQPEDPSKGSRAEGPSKSQPQRRRLFRDPDDRILGGVAAGLAHRFGIDTIIVRAILVALLFGAGPVLLLMYLFLWGLVPRARTASDRLAMKGDPVTVDGIRNSVEEQLKKAQDQFDDAEIWGRFKLGWDRFITEGLPQFIRTAAKVLGWLVIAAVVIVLLALGGLILSALFTGSWSWTF